MCPCHLPVKCVILYMATAKLFVFKAYQHLEVMYFSSFPFFQFATSCLSYLNIVILSKNCSPKFTI